MATKEAEIDDLRISKKENIQLGTVKQIVIDADSLVDVYLHTDQEGRGINGVIVQGKDVSPETLHEVALHIALRSHQLFLARKYLQKILRKKERAL